MLIGREKEIKELNELYHSEMLNLLLYMVDIVLVGKTYQIDEVFRDMLNFRHAGLSPIDSEKENVKAHLMKDQLTHFFRSLTMQGYK